jgi:LacI family transcriptional regulator
MTDTSTKAVTIFDVASQAGVSYSTVSRVISDDPRIKDETKQKVREVMERLGYVANYHARRLAGGGSAVVGVMVPDFGSGNAYLSQILQGIDAELMLAGYDMILYTAHRLESKEAGYISQVMGGLADGVLLILPRYLDSYLPALVKRRFPFALIDRQANNGRYPSVGASNWQGAFQATEYLLRLGHRRIGFITGWQDMDSSYQRQQGYEAALSANHVLVDQRLVVTGTFQQPDGFQGGNQLLDLPEPPTAVFAANDMMAVGVMDAARARGMRVPEDLSVMGFDDIPQSRFTLPSLTTVRQPMEQMGRVGMQMLLDLMKNPGNPYRNIELPTELVVRESCRVPRLMTVTVRPAGMTQQDK